MENILYNIIIYPIVQILDLCYLFFFRVFNNDGISIISVSLAVSVFTLPLYFEAERWQQLERDVRAKLAAKTAKIKTVFRGDEQYMVLSTFYRQNKYHPVYSLRSSIGLFLQIPFFIAAFSYLSNLDTLVGSPFLGIANLGIPDALLKIRTEGDTIISVNLLPILMTVVNIAASMVYLKIIDSNPHQSLMREKVQFFGMAAIFLLLLYNSPSGLVLYWACNNLFSLGKNILQNSKYSRSIIYFTACTCAVLLAVYVLFLHHGAFYKRLVVAVAGLSVFSIPFLIKIFRNTSKKISFILKNRDMAVTRTYTVVLSSIILFLLTGIGISSSLVASSVEEFSFIEQYVSPLPFILHTAEQALGFFVLWVLCVYFLLTGNKKYFLTALITVIAICGLINVYAFPGNYGSFTLEMEFSNMINLIPSASLLLLNMVVLLTASGLTVFFLCWGKKQIILSFQIIAIIALLAAIINNNSRIYREFQSVASQRIIDKNTVSALFNSRLNDDNGQIPVYKFSKTGKNILVIMLDRAIPGFVPQILKEKPELNDNFSGFTFYPNTISFGSHTLYGAPPLFGGYEYAPLEINARLDETLASKYNEAFLVMPEILKEHDYLITITDPPLYEDTIQNFFSPFPEITAANIMTEYTKNWLDKHPDVQPVSITALLNNRLIYFSFLKCAPLVFRHYIYDDGRWLAAQDGNTPLTTIHCFSMLDILPQITSFSDSAHNSLTLMVNYLPHEPAFLQAPDYTIPPVSSTNKGDGPFALEKSYHVNMAALLLLGKWFTWLKINDVYDNTRVIVVSDHGINNFSDFEGNIRLPSGECLQFYTALLMFKDFGAEGNLTIDNQFMVNADTPLLAVQGIIPNPVNPFSGKKLEAKKDGGVTITSSQNFAKDQYENRLDIGPTEWMHVKDYIFDPKNWTKTRVD